MSNINTEQNVLGMSVWGNGAEKFLFKGDDQYQIPLYQREYAWEEKQIRQLIEDIYDVADGAKYHIGSLIVAKKKNKNQVFYEVIDGQQRMTSLFLLLKILESKNLGIKVPRNLTFACRDKSNYSLENILLLIEENKEYDAKKIDSGILQGIQIFKSELKNAKQRLLKNQDELGENSFEKELIEKLKRIIIYRIQVPEETDLNRYFEIMNTRGEQLEHTDILKAKLMGFLVGLSDRSIFATIWDACSDMSGYVQMHFKDTAVRDSIFGDEWGNFPSDRWEDYSKIGSSKKIKSRRIEDILKPDFKIQSEDGKIIEKEKIDGVETEVEKSVRFDGLIDFSYFLLHVLKVFLKEEKGNLEEEKLLDDKKLLDRFKSVYHPKSDIERDSFSKKFVICLLRCRFLMDKFIVRREFVDGDKDGEWSLKELRVSGKKEPEKKESGEKEKRKDYRKPYYAKTVVENQDDDSNDKLKMLQSALRVSYTSPKVMHWITDELIWLMEHENNSSVTLKDLLQNTEKIAINAVKTLFFDKCTEKSQVDGTIIKYEMGVDTPHIVFNYLDYLLWKEKVDGSDNFTFEFRNTVEHWYPQNPSDTMFDKWEKEDGLDRFGNLCLIQREINSLFSNNAPDAKKSSFEKMIAKGSLKLRKMSELTVEKDGKKGGYWWKKSVCAEHEKEMIDKLKKACGLQG